MRRFLSTREREVHYQLSRQNQPSRRPIPAQGRKLQQRFLRSSLIANAQETSRLFWIEPRSPERSPLLLRLSPPSYGAPTRGHDLERRRRGGSKRGEGFDGHRSNGADSNAATFLHFDPCALYRNRRCARCRRHLEAGDRKSKGTVFRELGFEPLGIHLEGQPVSMPLDDPDRTGLGITVEDFARGRRRRRCTRVRCRRRRNGSVELGLSRGLDVLELVEVRFSVRNGGVHVAVVSACR
jgi:hypothetical protein